MGGDVGGDEGGHWGGVGGRGKGVEAEVGEKGRAKLSSEAADAKAKRSGEVEAGILDGFPYLRNEQVI